MKGLTLEGWCEEALRRWKSAIGPDGEVKADREAPSLASCVLSLLLTLALLCATAAACNDYPDMKDARQKNPFFALEAVELEPRSGPLMLIVCAITAVQLVVLILAMHFCAISDKHEEHDTDSQERCRVHQGDN
eukprot:g32188.t1